MALSLPKAHLIGVFLESLLYGVYLMVFIQCMQVLHRRQSRPSDYLLGTALSLFILITIHLVIDLVRTMDAFTTYMDISNYPAIYYDNLVTWEVLSRNALYVTTTVVSDAFIMYRSFILWDRDYLVIAIPFILFLADIATGVFWVYTIALVKPGQTVFVSSLVQHTEVFYGITLAMNVICTGLIAYRIWNIQRSVALRSKWSLVAIVIESGSIYCAVLMVMMVSYSRDSTAMLMFLATICPIIGIVFSYVIVRVGTGLSHGDSHPIPSYAGGNRTQLTFRLGQQQSDQLVSTGDAFPDHGIQVAMSHTAHTRVDGCSMEEVGKEVADAKDQSNVADEV